MAFCSVFKIFLDSKYLSKDLHFDTLIIQIRLKLLEIHQYKDEILFSWEAEWRKILVDKFLADQIYHEN